MSNGDDTDRFAESGSRVLQTAIAESRRHRQNHVSLWHVLKALAGENAASFTALVEGLNLDVQLAAEFIDKAMLWAPAHAGHGIRIAPQVNALFHEARKMAGMHNRERIEATDMLLVLAHSVRLGPPSHSAARPTECDGVAWRG